MKGVYLIICKKNGKVYIGRSSDIRKRIKTHLYQLRHGIHHNCNLQDDYDKYGRGVFSFKVKRLKTTKECVIEEQRLIDTLPNQYNIGLSSICGDNISRHPDKEYIIACRSRSQVRVNSELSEAEYRARFIESRKGDKNGMYGKSHSVEARRKISEKSKGNKNALGAVRSNEQRAKISEFAKTRIGEKNPFFGKHHSDETKERLRKANVGNLPANTLKVKVGKVIYESATAAAKDVGCAVASIRNRIENPKFPEYSYVS